MVILDTDHISLLDRKDRVEAYRLMERLHELNPDEIATTIVTYEEQMRGWLAYIAKARSIEQQVMAYQFLKDFVENYCEIKILEFDKDVALLFQRLQRSRIRIGTMDLKIAAIALANDALLLSRNLKDFLQVPNLRAEDWTKQSDLEN
jgi:tRNA(fMet)-specific endonuclease VapC